jgi:hypothetical protein
MCRNRLVSFISLRFSELLVPRGFITNQRLLNFIALGCSWNAMDIITVVFEVLTVMLMKIQVFWYVMPCSVVNSYRIIGTAQCSLLQGGTTLLLRHLFTSRQNVTSKKSWIFSFWGLGESNDTNCTFFSLNHTAGLQHLTTHTVTAGRDRCNSTKRQTCCNTSSSKWKENRFA